MDAETGGWYSRRMTLPDTRDPSRNAAVVVRWILCIASAVALASCSGSDGPPSGDSRGGASGARDVAGYVGRARCATCHEHESEQWKGSHHDLAMQPATEATVLGDFDDATYSDRNGVTKFSRRGDAFIVRTADATGTERDFEVAYVFGFDPLQQYLIDIGDGKLQALGVAWDTREASAGGERWFFLYPEEPIPPGDELHWTGRQQNWNFMCAECHSTGLRRNYDVVKDQYATSWTELDVSCEACHGPAAEHVAWAEEYVASGRGDSGLPADPDPDAPNFGFATTMRDRSGGAFVIDPETGNAARTVPLEHRTQFDTCAPCHSRRAVLTDGYLPGEPFLDAYLPSLLEEGLYHADGQILDEVYVTGSFRQSKMYEKGVRCTDCHDPHSLELRAEGNMLCSQCHDSKVYDRIEHHHHAPDSEAAQCVSCHMAARTYMVVDPRHDHSFRVPRPDLSVTDGTPNACSGCHADQTAQWAADAVAKWYGEDRRDEPHWGSAFAAVREGRSDAWLRLAEIAVDRETPGIVRGTALEEIGMRGAVTPQGVEAIREGVADPDDWVRLGAVRGGDAIDPRERFDVLGPLLRDPRRAVRVEAARMLASATALGIPDSFREAYDAAFGEFVAMQQANAERDSAHVNLGIAYSRRGNLDAAVAAYREAMRVAPESPVGPVNLADLYRATGNEAEADAVLLAALERNPDNPELVHAHGLLLARRGDYEASLERLAFAAKARPDNARMAYVYAIALSSQGDPARAIGVLEEALERHPRDRDILAALATISRDVGDLASSIEFARRLVARNPADAEAKRLLDALVELERR